MSGKKTHNVYYGVEMPLIVSINVIKENPFSFQITVLTDVGKSIV